MKDQVTELGEFIRAQRERSAISVRNLAERAGISNPYLSQIERGLRKPSAEILKGIAKGLSISAETLYVRAGLLEHPNGAPSASTTSRRNPFGVEIRLFSNFTAG